MCECDECGRHATHIQHVDVSDAVRGVHRDIRDTWYYCSTHAEEHSGCEPLPVPSESDRAFDQGLDDWADD